MLGMLILFHYFHYSLLQFNIFNIIDKLILSY